MRLRLDLVVVAVLFASAALCIGPAQLSAAERKGASAAMSAQQRQFILKAFAAAAPEAGMPSIVVYPDGAYIANARQGSVHVQVRRSPEGEVVAQYTTSGQGAARGVAITDRRGSGSSQTVFGPDGDRSAEFAASRLARMLAPPFP